MYKYKKIMAGLNLNENDPDLIQLTGYFAGLAGAEKLFFFHAIDRHEVPEEIRRKFPELHEPLEELTSGRMRNVIVENLKKNDGFECIAREGKPQDEILESVKEKNVDLLVIGRNASHVSSNKRAAEKLARKAPCSVLVVPQGSNVSSLKSLMVSVDFSRYSFQALEEAVAVASACGIKKITCLNVYHVPQGYGTTGKSYDEFAEIMLNNAKEEFAAFVNGFDSKGIEVVPEYILNKHVEKGILEAMEKDGCDLLVVGSRGRGAGASLFLGSVTEHLIAYSKFPVLAVKNKDEGMKMIDALLSVN